MKKILYVSIVLFIFSACKKDPKPVPPYLLNAVPANYLSLVQKYLHQHPGVENYDSIDFDKYRVSKQKTRWYLRLPWKNKSLATDFVLLQTDSLGNTADGGVVHLETIVEDQKNTSKTSFHGSILIRSLDQKTVIQSKITNGFIESLHPKLFDSDTRTINANKTDSHPSEGDELPEVIITAYYPSSSEGGLSYQAYMSLQNLIDGGSSSGTGAGGSTAPGSSNNPGIYSPVSSGGSNPVDADIKFNFDESVYRPAIDLNAWMKCFTDIPDAGATSTITLYGDLPVDGDPSIGLNIWNGNTGHCFLQLSKTNGSQSVTQIIGFTAQSAGKAILNADAFVPSKIVDNAGHKYNCSITMPLSGAGLSMVISTIKTMSDMPYSIVNYDCLDFALDVFNSVRGPDPLKISKQLVVNDPFSNIATGPKLYTLLSDMVDSHSPEAPYILISGSRWIGVSHGPCN